MHMLGLAEGRVRHRAVRLQELRRRDRGQRRPVRDRGGQVEALVEIEADPQAGLVDVLKVPEPGAEERNHPRVGIGEAHGPIPFGPFARVQGHSGDQELAVREPADAGAASARRRSISACLRRCRALGGRRRPRVTRGSGSNATSRTHRDTLLLETPRRAAISARGRPPARRRRACSRSTSLPRYPMVASSVVHLTIRPGCAQAGPA
jgi:hypothetical protein